jgi:hypothetical protein
MGGHGMEKGVVVYRKMDRKLGALPGPIGIVFLLSQR